MPCDCCPSSDAINYYLMTNNTISYLCYSCYCYYDTMIVSVLKRNDKGKCFTDIFTGHSYPYEYVYSMVIKK